MDRAWKDPGLYLMLAILAAWIALPLSYFLASRPATPATGLAALERPYVGSTASRIFHARSCPHVRRIAPANLLGWSSRPAAIAAGPSGRPRRPCRRCRP